MDKNQKISIPFSEEDLQDLQNGKELNWAFPTEKGESIDVCLYNEELSNKNMNEKINKIENLTDDELIEKREVLLDRVEKDKTQGFIGKIHELLEIDRELTLREDR